MKRKIFKNTKEISVKEKCNRKNVENTMVNDWRKNKKEKEEGEIQEDGKRDKERKGKKKKKHKSRRKMK